MAVCQKCGMIMADGMKFCGYCGAAAGQPAGMPGDQTQPYSLQAGGAIQSQPYGSSGRGQTQPPYGLPYGTQPGGQAQPPYSLPYGTQPVRQAQQPYGSPWETPQGYGNPAGNTGSRALPQNPFVSADASGGPTGGTSRPAGRSSASREGGFTVSVGSRIIKTLICLAIAAAIVAAIVIFFEIDIHDLDGYSRMVARTLTSEGWFTPAVNANLGKVAVYGLAAMIILGAFMLPARISGTVMKTIGIADKIVVVLAGYFLIAFIFFLKQYVIEERVIVRMWNDVMRVHGGQRFVNFLLFLVLILLLLIPVAFIIWSLKVLIGVVIGNIAVNGPILGIIGAAYELLSSVFTTALVLCAFSFGMAIILLPFIILLACQGGRRVVCIDGVYYYVD